MLFGNRNQLAPGLFGPSPNWNTPPISPPQDVTSAEPFVWGDAGARMTPEEIARRRALAAKMGQSDYSPVGHWTQGLGRVVDGLTAGLENRKLDKASAANTEHSAAIIKALLGGGGGDVAGAAMVDPTLSDDARKLATMQWERANPKPVNNDTAADLALIEGRLGRGAGDSYLQSRADPIVTIPLPGGQTYVGPRSGLGALTGGGGPASTSGAPPAMLPPDFQFDEGGPGAPQPRAGFR